MDAWVEKFAEWDTASQEKAVDLLLTRTGGRSRERASLVLEEIRKEFGDLQLDKKIISIKNGVVGNYGKDGDSPSKPRARSVIPQIDFVDKLPRVVCTNLLRFMEMKQLATCGCVSKRWKHRCGTVDELWKAEFLRLNPDSTYIQNLKMWRNYTWRGLCLLQGKSRHGWIEKPVEKRVFLGHKDRVRHVRLRSDTIVSASWDSSLRLVNLNDESGSQYSKQIATHSGSVFGVWFQGEVVVTCSEDSTIKIWNVFRESCVAELVGHASAVYRVAMISGEILVSCSRDFVGVWHWPSATLLHKLLGHTHDVHRIQVVENIIVTGSYDCTVRVWGYPSCEALWASPAIHDLGVSALHFEGNVLATGSAKGQVFVWDLESGARRYAFSGEVHNESTISCILVAGSRIFSTSNISLRQSDGIVCVWDVEYGQLLQRIVEPFHINALRKDFGLVYCACSDGKLRLRVQKNDTFDVVRELEHGTKPLYDVDVQGPRAVTCGLDRAVVLWQIDLNA